MWGLFPPKFEYRRALPSFGLYCGVPLLHFVCPCVVHVFHVFCRLSEDVYRPCATMHVVDTRFKSSLSIHYDTCTQTRTFSIHARYMSIHARSEHAKFDLFDTCTIYVSIRARSQHARRFDLFDTCTIHSRYVTVPDAHSIHDDTCQYTVSGARSIQIRYM